MEGIAPAHQGAKRTAQGRKRRQRYIDNSLKGLRPRYMQRKAQEFLMETPNATCNDFSTRIIHRDVPFQVSSNFLNDEEQTKTQMANLSQAMKNLGSELQEHRVNAVGENPPTVDPNQKEDKTQQDFATNAVRTDIPQVGVEKRYETNNWSVLKTKELLRKKSPLLRTTTKNEDQIMDQNNGLEAKISKEETKTLLRIDFRGVPLLLTRTSLQDQTWPMGIIIRTMEHHMITVQTHHSIETMETDLELDISTIRKGSGETMETFLVLHRLKGETSPQK